MSDAALLDLARAAGILVEWEDALGHPRRVAPDVLRRILPALGFPCETAGEIADSRRALRAERQGGPLPPLITGSIGEPVSVVANGVTPASRFRLVLETGEVSEGRLTSGRDGRALLPAVASPGYHRLAIGDQETTVALAPERAFTLADLAGERRLWGLAVQLYALRRDGDGGIGDFGALAAFAAVAGKHGADALAVSPVHALFAADPTRVSPYAPSSRLVLNVLHADPSSTFDEETIRSAIAEANVAGELKLNEANDLIDWPAAARAKLTLLRSLNAAVRERIAQGTGDLAEDFASFCAAGGEALEDHARFEALHAEALKRDGGTGHWRRWPPEYQDPRSPAVAAFAQEHAGEIGFHLFLQWLTDRSLAVAQAAARDAGMAIGLIGDLAVGTDGGGSFAWSRQGEVLAGLSIGAPPDAFNQLGQSWGLTAFSPRGLRRTGFRSFLATIRAALRHAGGLRIDHVLGFARLWLVPEGASPADGAYLTYPLKDLLRLIALESQRHRAIVIGEDLGTVPPGLRERLSGKGIMGMRVLWFERDETGAFVPPPKWPEHVAAMTTTHDLPTVAGWWAGRDIDWRASLGLFARDNGEAAERQARADDRSAVWAAFTAAGVAEGPCPPPEAGAAAADAALAFLAETPARLALVPVEDILGSIEQPNLPGTVDEHPNWRRRLPGTAEEVLGTPAAAERLAVLRHKRPGA